LEFRLNSPKSKGGKVKRKHVFFFLLFLLASTPATPATTIQPDWNAMVSSSHAIFLGTCTYYESRWDEAKRMIFTTSTFRVEKYLKGNLGPSIRITEPGGVLPENNLAMIVPHFPTFHQGEEVVVFVWTEPGGTHRVLGASEGKRTVRMDAATGRKMVQGKSLDEFLRDIDAYMRAQ
jgi:hypothetical protein